MTYNTPNDQANENIPSGKAMISGPSMTSNASALAQRVATVLLPYYTRCHQIIQATPPINNQLSLFCIVCVCRQPPGIFTFTTLTFH